MLKVTIEKSAIRVEGKLSGDFVAELEASWGAARAQANLRVDLGGVTFVDEAGRELLARMHAGGAQLVASGCATRRLVTEITGSEPETGA